MIDLFKGHPSPRLLPHDALVEPYKKVLLHPQFGESALEYAADEGDLYCRQRIATWLNRAYSSGEDVTNAATMPYDLRF